METIRSLIRELNRMFKAYGDLPVRIAVDDKVLNVTDVLVQTIDDGSSRHICLICNDGEKQ